MKLVLHFAPQLNTIFVRIFFRLPSNGWLCPQSCPARHLQKHLLSAIWPITSFSQPVKIKHSKQLKPWNVMPNHDAKLTWGRSYYCKTVSTYRVKFGPPPPPSPPPLIKIPGSAPVVIFYDITTELEKVGPTVLYILPGHS